MTMQYITVDEITEILDQLEVEYEIDLEDVDDPIITCVMSDEPFNLIPLGQGPFYEEFMLRTVIIPDFDPGEMCNHFNRTYRYCSAFTSTTHTDSTDHDEQTIVAIERAVMLCGGVSRDHIISTLHLWEAILLQAITFFNGQAEYSSE